MATNEDENRADRAMRAMHRELYPEKYPGWDAEEDGECYEWDSGTIEPIAERICRYVEREPSSEDETGAGRLAVRLGYIAGRYPTGRDLTADYDGEQYIAIEQCEAEPERFALTVHDTIESALGDRPAGWMTARVFDMHAWKDIEVQVGGWSVEHIVAETTLGKVVAHGPRH